MVNVQTELMKAMKDQTEAIKELTRSIDMLRVSQEWLGIEFNQQDLPPHLVQQAE